MGYYEYDVVLVTSAQIDDAREAKAALRLGTRPTMYSVRLSSHRKAPMNHTHTHSRHVYIYIHITMPPSQNCAWTRQNSRLIAPITSSAASPIRASVVVAAVVGGHTGQTYTHTHSLTHNKYTLTQLYGRDATPKLRPNGNNSIYDKTTHTQSSLNHTETTLQKHCRLPRRRTVYVVLYV